MRRRTVECLRCAALIVIVVGGTTAFRGVAAQRGGGRAQNSTTERSRGPGWFPRQFAIGNPWTGVTAAERAVVSARLDEYDRLFANPDSMARPHGFTMTPALSGGLKQGRWDVPRFHYDYIFLNEFLGHEGVGLLWVHENPSARDVWIKDSGPADFKDGEDEIFEERPRSGPLPGMPANAFVFDGLQVDRPTQARINVIRVVLTSDGQLPWTDVPRERVLRILMTEAETSLKGIEEAAARNSYQTWLNDAPKRQRDREEMLAGVAGVDRTQVAKVRESFEKAEREMGENLKKNDAATREQSSRNIATATARLTLLRERRAAMSPAERAMPAWIATTNQGTYEFAAPGTPGFRHLVVDKPDYYRFTGSRVQVRSLTIGFRLYEQAYVADMDRAVSDSYKGYDWAAAARVLNASTK